MTAESAFSRLIARNALALLLAVGVLWAPPASAAPSPAEQCPLDAPSHCENDLTVASADEEEEIGDEAEADEAEEERASAEEREEEEEAGPAQDGKGAASTTGPTPNRDLGSESRHDSHGGVPVVSHLKLTAKTATTLKHGKPLASAVSFAFMLSAPAKVRVTLVRQTNSRGHRHWTKLPDSITTIVGIGHRHRNLTGRNRLSPGRYRLTVKPANGPSRSIYLNTNH
ncbi:MAG TPA: hypothetical protein VGI26_06190 [Solirubrobacteraceae bacterium]|jgi:hypothetical protein